MAVVVAFGVSAYPLVATASAAVDQVGDIVPWIVELTASQPLGTSTKPLCGIAVVRFCSSIG